MFKKDSKECISLLVWTQTHEIRYGIDLWNMKQCFHAQWREVRGDWGFLWRTTLHWAQQGLPVWTWHTSFPCVLHPLCCSIDVHAYVFIFFTSWQKMLHYQFTEFSSIESFSSRRWIWIKNILCKHTKKICNILAIATCWHISHVHVLRVRFTTALVDYAQCQQPSSFWIVHCKSATMYNMFLFSNKLSMRYMTDVLQHLLKWMWQRTLGYIQVFSIMQIRGRQEVGLHRLINAVNIAWLHVHSWCHHINKKTEILL